LPSPDTGHPASLSRTVLLQEIRSLLLSPPLWLMLVVLSLITGYSFTEAVDIFGRASRTALAYPELARGMDPMEGIFVPTFGAYYLTETLLLPFVAIRLIGLDKESGALKLLMQLDLPPLKLCSLKGLAMVLVWLLSLVPILLVTLLWLRAGGHLHPPAFAAMLAAHALYSLVVIAVAMFCSTVADSLSTAAILCLSFTLGGWVLDFALSGQNALPAVIANLSLAGLVRQLENGLVTVPGVLSFLFTSLLFFSLAIIWIRPGEPVMGRLFRSLAVVILLAAGMVIGWNAPGSLDVSEQRKHSLNPADCRALRRMQDPLTITMHLARDDSRLLDLERGLLVKLRRCLPKLTIHYAETGETGLFEAAAGDNYGLVEYAYQGQRQESYSNSENEILAILHDLAGTEVKPEPVPTYPGYPLVTDCTGCGWWLYFLLPLCFACCGICCRKKL